MSVETVAKAFNLKKEGFCILDFETSKSENNIPGLPIQIGAFMFDKNYNKIEVSQYINQGDYNPENDMIDTKTKYMSITELTGVTREQLQSPDYEDQRITECELVHYNFTEGLIIGYNVSYDIRTLKEAYSRCGIPFENIKLVDCMGIFIDLYGNENRMVKKGCNRFGVVYYEDFKLDSVAHKLGVVSADEVQEHDALEDVRWTYKVLEKMIADHPDLDFSKYINKIYYNPCYEIPQWQRLTKEGVSYYPFGTNKKEARIWKKYTLYNYVTFEEGNW